MKKITIGKMPQLPFEMSEAINQLRQPELLRQ